MHKILVLALDGVMDSSLALTVDTLATANRLSSARDGGAERFRFTLFRPGRNQIETGLGGRFEVKPEVRVRSYDTLVIPGLGLSTPEAIDAYFASPSNQEVVGWLRRFGPRFGTRAAACSAVFLLAEAGLLVGRSATTTWWLGSVFRARYPEVDLDETRMLVESEDVVCAGAALAQVDLMLHLIARAVNPDLSRQVSRFLAIDHRPSQARYMMASSVARQSDEIIEIERWVRRNRSRAFSMQELAKSVGMSARTLDRRIRAATGSGPARFVQRLRLEQAVHLLETSNVPLSEIAAQVGYADATTLRRLLKRHLELAPSEIRRRALRE